MAVTHMSTATVRQIRNEFPALLRRVAHGETVTITRHGKTVAALSPPPVRPRPCWTERAERLAALFPAPLKGATVADLISEGRD